MKQRDTRKGPRHATREAAGYFCMLVLGAIATLGAVAITLPGLLGTLAGKPATGLWRATLIWVVVPGIGIALVHRLTRGIGRDK